MLSRHRRFEVSISLLSLKAFLVKTDNEPIDAWYKEDLEDKRRRKYQSQRQGRRHDEPSSDGEDEDDDTPRAIEAPPPPEPEKLAPQSRPRASSHTGQGSERPALSPTAAHS